MKAERTYLRTLLMLSMQRSCYADTEKRTHDCQDCAILSILIMFGSISERLLLYAISLIPLTILMMCSNTIVSTRFAFTTIQQHNVLFSFNSPSLSQLRRSTLWLTCLDICLQTSPRSHIFFPSYPFVLCAAYGTETVLFKVWSASEHLRRQQKT